MRAEEDGPAGLLRQNYELVSLDCSRGLNHAISELGRMLNWEQQFGYSLDADKRNLNALRDGFEFGVPPGGGRVFEINRPDIGWQEDSQWLLGLLAIAQEYSLSELALGRRFFTLLVVPEGSPLIGQTIETSTIPSVFWNPCREVREFER